MPDDRMMPQIGLQFVSEVKEATIRDSATSKLDLNRVKVILSGGSIDGLLLRSWDISPEYNVFRTEEIVMTVCEARALLRALEKFPGLVGSQHGNSLDDPGMVVRPS
jgi:hypothetical protein